MAINRTLYVPVAVKVNVGSKSVENVLFPICQIQSVPPCEIFLNLAVYGTQPRAGVVKMAFTFGLILSVFTAVSGALQKVVSSTIKVTI